MNRQIKKQKQKKEYIKKLKTKSYDEREMIYLRSRYGIGYVILTVLTSVLLSYLSIDILAKEHTLLWGTLVLSTVTIRYIVIMECIFISNTLINFIKVMFIPMEISDNALDFYDKAADLTIANLENKRCKDV